MIGVISFIIIIIFSLIVTRMATIALVSTGLSSETANFQARSAFSGVGFTTVESEKIVNHPVRRKIVLFLMLIGNAGVVTSVTTLILAFISPEEASLIPRLMSLSAGVLAIWLLSSSKFFNKYLTAIIERLLRKYTDLDIRDYSSLLHLSSNYKVIELAVQDGDWLSSKTLNELKLGEEGVLVLALERDKDFLGVPVGTIIIKPGDLLILYGRETAIKNLDRRKTGQEGDKEHNKEKRVQEKVLDKQLDLVVAYDEKDNIH
ncbi:MAG: TrkA C-terminal domain-containing protein [Bacteriovoracaceae bacterium]|nr:TrkA C-terminal domain-containing protein [Bacteriovoracaceae bacterium]